MNHDLEHDLYHSNTIKSKCNNSEIYSQNLYAALCNNRFFYNNEEWTVSWRGAGAIVSEINKGDQYDYMDYYCSGMGNCNGFVCEGFVTEEIRLDLIKLGWIIKPYEPRLEPGLYRNEW